MRKKLLGSLVSASLLVLGAGAAEAHAVLIDSTPPIGASVPAGEIGLRLRFNSRIDRARSRLTLIRADHSTSVLPIDKDGTDDLLLSQATLAPGNYTVRWQVLAVDGHITRGDIPLTAAPKAGETH